MKNYGPWYAVVKGRAKRRNITFSMETALIAALTEFTIDQGKQIEQRTKKGGRLVLSRETVVKTVLLKRYPELRARYNQLKQEQTNAKDNIKDSIQADTAHE